MREHPTERPTSSDSIPWDAGLRLIRFRNQTGTALLLLPTCWALVLAERGFPSPRLLMIFIAGSFLMRSAGVVLNDLADQSFDRRVARTTTRPLASGELTRRQAFVILAILLLPAAGLLWLLNPLTLWLSPIALALAALYPFSKRVLHIPQAMLGLAFGWGTIMAWAAARGTLEPTAWTVFAATIAWAIAYDTIYAIQDLEDDRRIGVKSSALFFGSSLWLAVGLMLGVMLVLLLAAGLQTGIGWPYFLMLGAVSVFFAMQTGTLRGVVTPPQAFRMFQAHVWVGLAIFVGLIAGFLA
ncbi:4-hydroxybenzoate octaprenyltransferase [Nitrospira lenta]|uniref:4-hydroxybenzoate octaprenyltransferase n=1 Tax=Nitrospira lenta TaxID=1436998 RepID=A0A330L157_9BACT|nr:4-hydroxybenzoate octaprenyltransferase [Nitrospira lenta]SPP63488.1 4-hydroxybenzoate octaprenyltransferase [Nitrospira lenta]